MMIPSAPLSSRAFALISFPDLCPTRVTLKTMEGDRIFRIVSPGTGVESLVSNKEAFTREQETEREPIDSAAIGGPKNPQGEGLRRDASVAFLRRRHDTRRRRENWSHLHHPRGLRTLRNHGIDLCFICDKVAVSGRRRRAWSSWVLTLVDFIGAIKFAGFGY